MKFRALAWVVGDHSTHQIFECGIDDIGVKGPNHLISLGMHRMVMRQGIRGQQTAEFFIEDKDKGSAFEATIRDGTGDGEIIRMRRLPLLTDRA